MPQCKGCAVQLVEGCLVYDKAGGEPIEGADLAEVAAETEIFCIRCAYPDHGGPARCWFCGVGEGHTMGPQNPSGIISVDPTDCFSPPALRRRMCITCQRERLAGVWSHDFDGTLRGVLVPAVYGAPYTAKVHVGDIGGIILPYDTSGWADRFPIAAWFAGGRESVEVGFRLERHESEMYATTVTPCRTCVRWPCA